MFYPSGERYQGEWHNNLRHGERTAAASHVALRPRPQRSGSTARRPGAPPPAGKGALTYRNGDKYEGDWQCGLRHGLGSLWLNVGGKFRLRYSGHWANDQPTVSARARGLGSRGTGTLGSCGCHPVAALAAAHAIRPPARPPARPAPPRPALPRPARACPQGQGRYVEDNGDTYDGEWRDGLRHGRGRATYGGRPGDGAGADVYEGCWEGNMRCARRAPGCSWPAPLQGPPARFCAAGAARSSRRPQSARTTRAGTAQAR
jgi:hypothetical protein